MSTDENVPDSRVRMTKVVRSNLRVRLSDAVTVTALPDIKFAKSVRYITLV